eukprot:5354310-Pyramimonas_sp.AAC.1
MADFPGQLFVLSIDVINDEKTETSQEKKLSCYGRACCEQALLQRFSQILPARLGLLLVFARRCRVLMAASPGIRPDPCA